MSATIKDAILTYLVDHKTKGEMTEKIASDLQLPHFTVVAMCKDIEKDEYIANTNITTVNSILEEYIAMITPKGQHFIFQGGYTSVDRKRNYSRNWKTIQNVIIAITAVLAVLIGMRTCAITDKTNELQRQIDTLKTK